MGNKLGEYLRKERKANNMSLREFSEYLGISHTYLSKLENGVDPRTGKAVSPTIETLKQISKAMNISLEKLLSISGYINTKYDDINQYTEKDDEKTDIPEYFETPQDAIKFILEQPMIANFGGYDLELMEDDEIMDMAEDVADMLRIMAKKHKNK